MHTVTDDEVWRAVKVIQRLATGRASFLVAGVDPGAAGAAALLRVASAKPHARLVELVDLTDINATQALIERAELVTVERQRSSPRMGVASAFTLGAGAGAVDAMVRIGTRAAKERAARSGFPREVAVGVEPTVWRGAFGLRATEGGKMAGIRLAMELTGETTWTRHDHADAVLLAWWGWRNVSWPAFRSFIVAREAWAHRLTDVEPSWDCLGDPW